MQNKITVLLKGPLLTSSGYGAHSRMLLRALLKDPSLEVLVEPTGWGNCSFVTDKTKEINTINQLTAKTQQAINQGFKKPNIFIHCTIPNEFERKGDYNIGVTAGIETDLVAAVWLQKCNEMDLIVVPSEFAKQTFVNTAYDTENRQTGERGVLKLETPVEVVSEGINPDIFKKSDKLEKNIKDLKFDADFNFLHVGLWGNGGIGEDRKNIGLLLFNFFKTFHNRKDTGLVLKTSAGRNTQSDFEIIKSRVNEIKKLFGDQAKLPPVHILHANFTEKEMASLYNHPQIKAFVSMTAGECFGIPLLESAFSELPIIATNHSGHLDFLEQGKFSAIKCDLKPIPKSVVWDNVLIENSRWAYPDREDASHRMKLMRSKYSKPKEWAKELAVSVREKFSANAVDEKLINVIKQNCFKETAGKMNPVEYLESLIDDPNAFNVLYTMPRSAGDVYISTAVIDGLIKNLPPDTNLYFATDPQYADILKDNPNIHGVVEYNQLMMNTELCEEVFDLYYSPDVTTQYVFSNFQKKGFGRTLAEEYATHCLCEPDEYFIKHEELESEQLPKTYMTFHPGSGKDKWEARKYEDWPEILKNIKGLYPDLSIVQVGSADEPEFESVDVDLRGKTNVNQLAKVIADSTMHLSIDTFSAHLCGGQGVPLVALYGCSYAKICGPWVKDKSKAKFILLESERMSCQCKRACSKDKPKADIDYPPINEIDPMTVVDSCRRLLDDLKVDKVESFKYERVFPTLEGYTTTYNCIENDFPFIHSIESALGICDSVCVVDGCSTDGTWEKLEELAEKHDNLQIYQNEFDWNSPGVDGNQKSFARALCDAEYLLQFDVDEFFSVADRNKWRMLTKRFPRRAPVLHLPVVELWGDIEHATARRHIWKWRISKNSPEISHGINKHARITNEETGQIHARHNMSDGCEYIDVRDYSMVPHVGFYSGPSGEQIETARKYVPEDFEKIANQIYSTMPSVWHTSWLDLPRKIKQLNGDGIWKKLWALLYQESEPKDRFPGVKTEEQVQECAKHLYKQGAEDSDQTKYKFKLRVKPPKHLLEWLEEQEKENK